MCESQFCMCESQLPSQHLLDEVWSSGYIEKTSWWGVNKQTHTRREEFGKGKRASALFSSGKRLMNIKDSEELGRTRKNWKKKKSGKERGKGWRKRVSVIRLKNWFLVLSEEPVRMVSCVDSLVCLSCISFSGIYIFLLPPSNLVHIRVRHKSKSNVKGGHVMSNCDSRSLLSPVSCHQHRFSHS